MSTVNDLVRVGERDLAFGGPQLGELRASNDITDDAEALHRRLAGDGYLLIRGLIDPAAYPAAREVVLERLGQRGCLDEAAPLQEARIGGARDNPGMIGKEAVVRHPDMLRVLEAPELFAFFARLFAEQPRTTSFKWLRVVGDGAFTNAHMDTVYMNRGSQRLLTSWIPVGDVPRERGALAILAGSHDGEAFRRVRETYGRADVDRDHIQGWLSSDPQELLERYGGRWLTTDFAAGDILIFGLHTMHMSLTNVSGSYRISADVRWQPQSEPADERWFGERPSGHYAWRRKPVTPVAESRREWGI